jgi:hypothetical protein
MAALAAILAPLVVHPALASQSITELATPGAEMTLTRVTGSWVYGPKAVWTLGTTSPHFVPLSEPVESAGIINVRVSTEMESNSGDCQLRPALRYSADGVNWDTPKEILAGWRTTNGIDYGQTYIDITALAGTPAKTFVQFGVQARNGSNGAIQLCLASIRVEPKER